MTNKQYHSHPNISKSDLDLLAKSPAHYKAKGSYERKETPAMRWGSAVHKILLEFEDFGNEYTTNKDFKGTHTVLKDDEYKELLEIRKAVLNNPIASNLLSGGMAENSFFSELESVPVKCRPDYFCESKGLIIDLKTTEDCTLENFTRSVATYNYHTQAKFYTDILTSLGFEIKAFVFLVVEKKPPYFTAEYILDEEALLYGYEEYQKGLALFKHCTKTDEWFPPCKFDSETGISLIQEVSLPKWKKRA